MSTDRKPGMDHSYYHWSPISERPHLRWPQDARVALCVILDLEHADYQIPADAYRAPGLAGGRGNRPHGDYSLVSGRDYGLRVGIFRLFEVLDRYGIKGTVAMDALTAENYPIVIEECRHRGWEFIGHGVAVTRMITSKMTEAAEKQYIQQSLDSLDRATGAKAVGWLGPEYGESAQTPQLLAQAGVRYVCDWVNDEQPYPMTIPGREMFSLPVTWELDDALLLWNRSFPNYEYTRAIKEAFEVLYRDGASNGRLLVLNLHPFLIGQPYRIKYLEEALNYIISYQGVWPATGREIIDWYAANHGRTP